MRWPRELLQAGRHRRVSLLAALLALAPHALVLADARAPAFLASAPDSLVLADARPPALLAFAPDALVLADARPPALLVFAPDVWCWQMLAPPCSMPMLLPHDFALQAQFGPSVCVVSHVRV